MEKVNFTQMKDGAKGRISFIKHKYEKKYTESIADRILKFMYGLSIAH